MKKAIAVIAVLVIVACAGSLYLSLYGLALREDTRAHRALGQIVGEEAVKLGGAGARIILITRDTSFYKNPAFDAMTASFQAALTAAGSKVGLTHTLKVDPLRATQVPPGDFLQILKKATDKDVLVSFLGPPLLTEEQLAGLGGKLPKLVAVCTGNMPRQFNLRRTFDQGLLHLAILSKPSADNQLPGGGGAEACFDHLFLRVTSANLAELPAPAPVPARP
ncbi:MAG TPA: hypothetical protein VNH84_11825 [Candidatus Saccharimonadales bacterium]|nr:hypothetical protein [Candidatus Saccharimonadales bacterium]